MVYQSANPEQLMRDRIHAETQALVSEFSEKVSQQRIEQEMSNAVSEFVSAKVKEFVPLLAGRDARDRLQSISEE